MENQISLTENYFVNNGKILPTTEFYCNFNEKSRVLYEVIRVKESAPIFFNQHIERLEKSVKILGLISPDTEKIKQMVIDLLKVNPINENNFRISLIYNDTSEYPDLLIYFIPSYYPSTIQREIGVALKTFHAFRDNPNIKVENRTLRMEADRIIKESGCYEILLVNDEEFVTEGSRSNVFFVKNNSIITPPINMVLGGITRQVVIEIAKKVNIPIIESTVKVNEINKFDGAFITGTSPGLLPIAKIDDICYNVKSALMNELILAYDALVKENIFTFKSHQK